MPKKLLKVDDFSGGTNGYADPQNIEDNELAQCSGFKSEKGEIIVLGDMKAAYSLGSHTAAGEAINIESGYGLFTFSHDYDKDGNLVSTDYYVIQNAHEFNIYDNTANAWIDALINLGTGSSDNAMPSIKPCFFFVDGALRVSPGNFAKVDSGANLNSEALTATNAVTIDQMDTSNPGDIVVGDLVVIDGIEVIAARVTGSFIDFWRNLTGAFSGVSGASSAMYVMPDTRWRGIVDRRNFQSVTTLGTFTEWYSTFMHPRAPVQYDIASDYNDALTSFVVTNEGNDDIVIKGYVPIVEMATKNAVADAEGTWDSTYIFYMTALYDEAKQESQPTSLKITGTSSNENTIVPSYELGIWIGIEYSDDGSNYEINKRITGARLYYQDILSDDNNLYQLIEIDFVKGCKKAEEESFHKWVRWAAPHGSSSDYAVACPTSAGAEYDTRTGANAFVFKHPSKTFTYEINTGYSADVSTHARFKTAVVANRRTYIGNVYQGGRAYGDRMIKSPVNKFDLLPETNFIDVAVGDGDEIVKLEAFADRLLQFKKRTLYIINIGGDYEFLESQHANMGVENPSQTCMTEFGVAWVNKFGVYIYDGKGITELSRGKLKAVDTTDRARALNIIESNIPLIGYHSLNKWIVVHLVSDVGTAFDAQAWIYDFKNGSWTWSQEFTADADTKTNLINTHDNELVVAAGVNAAGDSTNTPDFFKFREVTADPLEDKLFLLTKDFTLDVPSIKKNVYSVYITYSLNSASGGSQIEADLIYRHSTGETTIELIEANAGTTYYTKALGFKTTSGKKTTVELVPESAIKNANSFQLKLHNRDAAHDSSDDFRLYSISFRYRAKGVH